MNPCLWDELDRRACPDCGAVLVQKYGESARDWQTRRFCSRACMVTHQNKNRRHSKPEYDVWSAIVQRCTNPKNPSWPRYGGRGIAVCEEWRLSFDAFFAAVGPRPSPKHSIERQDNNRGYEPGNVKWATLLEQARNKRTNRYLTAFGKTQTLSEWAREIGVGIATLISRIDIAKWPIELALANGPQRGRRRKHHPEKFNGVVSAPCGEGH